MVLMQAALPVVQNGIHLLFPHEQVKAQLQFLAFVQFTIWNIPNDAFSAQHFSEIPGGGDVLLSKLQYGNALGCAALPGGQIQDDHLVTRHGMLGKEHAASKLRVSGMGSHGQYGFLPAFTQANSLSYSGPVIKEKPDFVLIVAVFI